MIHSLYLTHRQACVWFWQFLPRALLRLLPADSRRFGPPRRYSSWAQYARRFPTRWIDVPVTETRLNAPFYDSHPERPLLPAQAGRLPSGIAIIPDARLFDREGWVVGQGDRFLSEFHEGASNRFCEIYGVLKCQPPQVLPGRTLNLTSTFARSNFYHWMIHGVGRLELFQRAGFGWDDVDHVCLSRLDTDSTREIVRRLAIPPEKLLRINNGQQYACEELWQPTLPGEAMHTAGNAIELHRRLLPPLPRQQASRRVYMARTDTRMPATKDEIRAILLAHGFEELRQEDFAATRQQLADATHIVAVHGAALTNLLYCHAGTRVLELIAHANPPSIYHSLCDRAGLSYGLVRGPSKEAAPHTHLPLHGTFTLDMDDFKTGLKRLLADD